MLHMLTDLKMFILKSRTDNNYNYTFVYFTIKIYTNNMHLEHYG